MSLGIFEFGLEGFSRKRRSSGKHPAKDGDVDGILDSTEVEASKGAKGEVASPVDVGFVFDYFLDEEVGGGCFDGGYSHAKGEGVLDGDAFQALPGKRHGTSVGTVNCSQWSRITITMIQVRCQNLC